MQNRQPVLTKRGSAESRAFRESPALSVNSRTKSRRFAKDAGLRFLLPHSKTPTLRMIAKKGDKEMKSQRDTCRKIVLGRLAQARTPRGLIRLVLSILFTALALATTNASAQTLTTLYPFGNSITDGQNPDADLIDTSGNFYGTTIHGGENGYGTVFKLTPSGSETVLYSFGSSSADGWYPQVGLIADASGNLYGTTYQGGAYGFGTVFKLTPSKSVPWTETVLYSFGSSSADGQGPLAGLIADASGNLYGTTFNGGTSDLGTVFKLTPSGSETILHSFSGFPSDGAYPQAGLIADASGNFYSTTNQGGASNGGTVFEVTPSGTEIVLHSFANSPDGLNPFAGLIADASGNLYGTTAAGGENGNGTVFKLMKQAGTWIETVLYSFGRGTSSDGVNPYAGLIADASGNLYGTTFSGGDSTNCRHGVPCGTVFKLTPLGIETVLYSFTGGSDGENPFAGLIADASGNLYGTTYQGGAYGYGTVFKLTGAGYVAVPFTITPTPKSETIKRGDWAVFLLTLKSLDGFKGEVTLSCSGGPAGSYCADLPQTLYLNGTAYAVSGIRFPKDTTPGTYVITFTGTSGSLTAKAAAKFIVK